MGYYSDVAIRVQSKAFERLAEKIKETAFSPDNVMYNACSDLYTIYWYDRKWYSSSPEVRAVENVLDELDAEHDMSSEDGLAYKYIRIGEETDDIEEKSNDYDLGFYVLRDFDNFDVGKELEPNPFRQ